jgi:hypothetical protein
MVKHSGDKNCKEVEVKSSGWYKNYNDTWSKESITEVILKNT